MKKEKELEKNKRLRKEGEYVNTRSISYLIKRFAPYFKPYKKILILDLACALLTTFCDLILPIVIRFLTNKAISTDGLAIKTVLYIGGIYFILRIMDVAANYYMAKTGHMMGAKIETDMRRDLFNHISTLTYSYFSTTKVGQLMSRITSDLFEVTEFAHHCPEEYFIALVKFTVAFLVLSNYSLSLTLIIFALIPIMLFFASKFKDSMRVAFKKQRNQVGEINAQVEDALLGIRVVKSFANEEIEKEKFNKGNRKFLEIKDEAYSSMAGFTSTIRFFDGMMYFAVIVFGGLFLYYGKITTPDFVAYLLYVTMLLTTIRRILEFTEQFQRGMTGIERFVEIMDEEPEINDKPDAIDINDVEGNVNFENVGFSYSENDSMVLSKINLNITAGRKIALVGPSGSGKTTMANLVPRFYDVTEGKITIDGIDVKDITLKSLRSNIGIVQQEVYLFSGTIFDNILYGRPEAEYEEVIAAAKLAAAHDFIMEMPDGYNTYVGERGVRLSGGQKQRISIARVFLKNPPILILDEATSALDNEAERIVQKSLDNLAEGRTTFTIAHRLTTIKNSDAIVYLDIDGIKEVGSHEELMENKGEYYRLYSMYSD